jgi:hypothetical protein
MIAVVQRFPRDRAVRSARLVHTQEAEGSNPSPATSFRRADELRLAHPAGETRRSRWSSGASLRDGVLPEGASSFALPAHFQRDGARVTAFRSLFLPGKNDPDFCTGRRFLDAQPVNFPQGTIRTLSECGEVGFMSRNLNTQSCVKGESGCRRYRRDDAARLRLVLAQVFAPAIAETVKAERSKTLGAAIGAPTRTIENWRAGKNLVDLPSAFAIALKRPNSPLAREMRALLSIETDATVSLDRRATAP